MKKLFRIISRTGVLFFTAFYLLAMRWWNRRRPRCRRVLIVAPLRLGDFCMFLPTAAELTGYFRKRGLQITLLVTPALEEMARRSGADEIMLHPYPENAVSLTAAYRFYRQLSGCRFQVAVAAVTERSFFHDDLPLLYSGATELYLPRAVRLPERFWGVLPFWVDRFFFRDTIELPDYVLTPEMQNYGHLVQAVTGDFPAYCKPELPMAERPLFEGKYILFAPGSQDISRCLDMETAHAVISHLSLKYQVVIAGTAGEYERAEMLRRGNEKNCFNFCGKSDLPGLIRLIYDADAVVGVDSGIANLAILSGKNAIIALGQANLRFMFVPPDAEKSGFQPPLVCRSKELCPYRNCNWNCPGYKKGNTYQCMKISAGEFIAVIEHGLENFRKPENKRQED